MTVARPTEILVTLPVLADRIADLRPPRRIVLCLAGPPASGKSHVAAALRSELRRRDRRAEILPMDGYHLDDAVLSERGLLARKGAPETFDVGGLVHMLDRLVRNEEAEIAVPVFDRRLEISRAGARMIARETGILIVEGNYLLLDRSPWSGLAARFDVTVRLGVPDAVLRERLLRRWTDAGIPPRDAVRRVEENDLPNCRLVLAHSLPARFLLET